MRFDSSAFLVLIYFVFKTPIIPKTLMETQTAEKVGLASKVRSKCSFCFQFYETEETARNLNLFAERPFFCEFKATRKIEKAISNQPKLAELSGRSLT